MQKLLDELTTLSDYEFGHGLYSEYIVKLERAFPSLASHIRTLEREHRAMQDALQTYVDNSECSDEHRMEGGATFGPNCKHCNAVEILSSLAIHD